jgi:hypothetical protein
MNNRQAGRRRGRGGQRPQGGNPNAQGGGNRIDSRARGNAAQLLEKYKNLARDAQMQGDRVNSEYYLQFADHYFRVLSESRSRFEEQNQNQNQRRHRDDEDGEDFELEADGNRPAEEQRYEREDRAEQPYDNRDARHGGYNGRANGGDAEADETPEPREEARGRGRRPRREAVEAEVEPQGIDAAVLPPAFGGDVADADEDRPRPRRGRRPRADDAEAPIA